MVPTSIILSFFLFCILARIIATALVLRDCKKALLASRREALIAAILLDDLARGWNKDHRTNL
jgi:hypothetical protein